jgi:hypothetical protein
MKLKLLLSISIVGAISSAVYAQGYGLGVNLPPDVNSGYGLRGAGGLRANSILGSGGLRGASIMGSGGVGGRYSGSNYSRAVGPAAYGGATSATSKPFSNYTSQPAVSPYLNLFRNDANGQNQFNYSTLVQPQLRQQQLNAQAQRQAMQNGRRLQSISAQSHYTPEGSRDEYPTGHQTVFNYKGHYFNTPRPHPKKQAAVQ